MADDSQVNDGQSPTMHNLLRDVPDPDATIVKLEQDKDGTWREIELTGEHRVSVAQGSYDFVVRNGEKFGVKEHDDFDWGHTEAAGGKPVSYAGRVHFDDGGQLREWDNGSGHYLPNRAFASNAGLPMDKFKPHTGVHGMKVQVPVFQPGPQDHSRRTQELLDQSRRSERSTDASVKRTHTRDQGGRTQR